MISANNVDMQIKMNLMNGNFSEQWCIISMGFLRTFTV